MKKITFVLPMPARVSIGGYKIIYEYADRLAEKYNVTIMYVVTLPFIDYKYPYFIRLLGAYYILYCKKYHWYEFKNKVKLQVFSKINNSSILDSDAIIATAWETSYWVSSLDVIKAKKYYFIQGYEIWNGKEELVLESYKLGLKNIVITKWLENKIKETGADVYDRISNGIDFEQFYVFNTPENRDDLTIAMMYHVLESKGSQDGIKVLKSIKNKFKNLNVIFFSVYPRDASIPEWVHYIEKPDKEQLNCIYNNCAIFLSASWSEGFGLTGAESMACGCALVTTDNGGCRDYAIHNETALLCNPADLEKMEKNITRLISDSEFRVKLANKGNELIKAFSWEISISKFEKKIIENS